MVVKKKTTTFKRWNADVLIMFKLGTDKLITTIRFCEWIY